MNKEKMTEARAGKIALAIISQRATKQEVSIDPNDRDFWHNIAKRYRVTVEQAQNLFYKVILPIVVAASTNGQKSIPSGIQSETEELELGKTAIQKLRSDGIDLHPTRSREWLIKLADATGIHIGELEDFFLTFIIPSIIARIMKWDECSITGHTNARPA